MVVLVPITLGAPAVFVFVPPPVILAPAALARFVQFMALVVCLRAVASMFFDGLVKFMVGVSDPALTALVVVGVKPWDRREQQSRCQYGS